MGFPVAITDRFLREGDILALKMLDDSAQNLYPLQIQTVEFPNNQAEFSIGAAAALTTAGTGWNTIQNSSNQYILEPEYAGIVYHVFYGITPSYARIYRQYPSGVDRGNLTGTRAPGTDPVGYISGDMSPLLYPSPVTEFFTVRGQHPAFYGYHPYARPSSATIRMTFYIVAYGVTGIKGVSPDWVMGQARRVITMGGRTLMQAPGWLKEDVADAPNGIGGV